MNLFCVLSSIHFACETDNVWSTAVQRKPHPINKKTVGSAWPGWTGLVAWRLCCAASCSVGSFGWAVVGGGGGGGGGRWWGQAAAGWLLLFTVLGVCYCITFSSDRGSSNQSIGRRLRRPHPAGCWLGALVLCIWLGTLLATPP